MAFLDVVIQVLNINCSVVQCSGYASEIEALFYVLFFPTVFIILFVYIVTGAIISKIGGAQGAFRILISVALYAFIIFEGFYSTFASLSRVWWLLLVTLVGLWLFIRQFIHGGGNSGGSPMSGFKGKRSGSSVQLSQRFLSKLSGNVKKKKVAIEQSMKELEGIVKSIEKEAKNPSPGTDIGNLRKEYNGQKTTVLALIDGIQDLGKVDVMNTDWKVIRIGEEYENKLKELDERVEKAA